MTVPHAAPPAARGSLCRDPLFLLALAAGPVCWLVLYHFDFLAPVPAPDKPLRHPWWFLQLALLYPVLEEIVFRGLIQELVRDYVSRAAFGPLSLANLLTSLLFAGAHLYFNVSVWAALVFFPSLVFGFFKERSGRLLAPIVLHAFYNAGFVWLFTAPR